MAKTKPSSVGIEAMCIEDGEEDKVQITFLVGLTDEGMVRFGLSRMDGRGDIYVDISTEAATGVIDALSETIMAARSKTLGGFLHAAGNA